MDRFADLKRILAAAIELPPHERSAYVERECEGDAALLADVRAKLRHLDDDPSLLRTGGLGSLLRDVDAPTIASDPDATVASGAPPPSGLASASGAPGDIANYRIVDRLGEGGMGVVWLAEQQSPRRQVALKVIRGGHFVDEMRVRMFQREVETLGRLKHPNIAAIYESGRTDDGQHFFAMELVQGDTLDRYLASRGAAQESADELRFRLRLFRKIADAVHYAHQRGVIHRDLKPSNIIVTHETSDAGSATRASGPDVKVLDFGLARITDADVHATTMSEVGAIKGTLPYMSPEQARGNPDEIDVRTDVYSLGVILYEMLIGALPYDTGAGSLLEAVRIICEESPRTMRPTAGRGRGIDPDVETICLKALEKDADRRYSTAAAMADDVERYLTSQPIVARPPSTVYQLRKFAARNRALVGGVVATFAVLVAGVTVSTTLGLREARQRKAAERESDRATAVQEFLQEMITTADPFEETGPLTTMGEVLKASAARIEDEFADRPAVEASLRYSIGRTYVGFTEWDDALPQLRRALELFRQVYPGEDRHETAECLRYIGECLEGRSDPECLPVLEESYAMHGRLHGPEALETATAEHDLAFAHYVVARTKEGAERDSLLERSAELYLDSQKVFLRIHGEDDEAFARCLHAYAVTLWTQEKKDEALAQLDRAIGISKRAEADVYTQALYTDHGILLRRAGHLDEAAEAAKGRLDLARKIYGDQWPHLGHALTFLAEVELERGRPDAAAAPAAEAVAFWEDLRGADSEEAAAARELLARARGE